MIEVTQLPAVNAMLNATSAVLLAVGFVAIRTGKRRVHIGFMVAAVVVSVVFLTSYLYYHSHVTGVTRFAGTGASRPVYFTILLSHTILAMVVALWLVPVTLYRAARQQFDKHRGIARWTLPLWFYVSVTGVIIYFMLYHWYVPT